MLTTTFFLIDDAFMGWWEHIQAGRKSDFEPLRAVSGHAARLQLSNFTYWRSIGDVSPNAK